ncbi:MAG: hypothetical protein Q7S58_15695 [Candidatus Binatus sp.]|uniref:hypothetical protein n=1 Tax=Candidatus Binatus sp. TaxID=2811406 RepID=UPI002720388C|nr:hypothetical protein [Candidatus Binatus sp.]MDO8433844.1 hypothetical protein [Candidatus Binatus sp.]
MPLILQTSDIDSLRSRARDVDVAQFDAAKPSGITLPALLELVCSWSMWSQSAGTALRQIIDGWSQDLPDLRHARKLFAMGDSPKTPGSFDAPRKELWHIRSRSDWADDPAFLFQARFRRSLEKHGFGKKLSLALSKAMQEMADNIIQHSGPDEEHPAVGLVGYHVDGQWMTYAVADVGRGVLASLETNPKWSTLTESGNALRAAVYQRASRRVNSPYGTGFSEVQKSLADLNGTLRFRSGDASLTLVGQRAARQAIFSSNPYLVGFQLAVTCGLAVDSSIRALPHEA